MGGVGDQPTRGVEHGAGEVQSLFDVHADGRALSDTDRGEAKHRRRGRQPDGWLDGRIGMRRLEASRGEEKKGSGKAGGGESARVTEGGFCPGRRKRSRAEK